VAFAQQPKGISPCSAATINANGTSSNIQLSQCGASVVIMNLTSQEAFFNVGKASSTAATANNYSIPGGAYIIITVPNNDVAGWYLAGFTATSSTTLRIIVGNAL
jgi:hypothetical protein